MSYLRKLFENLEIYLKSLINKLTLLINKPLKIYTFACVCNV